MTLTEFLLARIAEDEAVGRVGWQHRYGLNSRISRDDEGGLVYWPSRVIAECEAKRRIVEVHPRAGSLLLLGYEECGTCVDVTSSDVDATTEPLNWPCPTVKALAAPYADHPDYRQDWKP